MEISIIQFFISTLGCIVVGFFCGASAISVIRKNDLQADRDELSSLREANLKLLERKAQLETKNAELENRQSLLKDQFKASANSILLELSKTNREKHSEELDTIISPLKKQIEEFKKEFIK